MHPQTPNNPLLIFYTLGILSQHTNWRWAFVVLGTPGVALTLPFVLTLREPEKGLSERLNKQKVQLGMPIKVSSLSDSLDNDPLSETAPNTLSSLHHSQDPEEDEGVPLESKDEQFRISHKSSSSYHTLDNSNLDPVKPSATETSTAEVVNEESNPASQIEITEQDFIKIPLWLRVRYLVTLPPFIA